MKDKYTVERVNYELRDWEYAKDKKPALESILSRISISEKTLTKINGKDGDNNENGQRPLKTTFVITKKYPMLISLNILGHYYKCFNDKTWHPGDTTSENIFGSRDPNYSSVITIEELCDHCFYHSFQNLFYRDVHFNLVLNNCQVITGYIAETILVILYFITLALVIFTGQIIFLIILLSLLLIVILYNIFQITTNNITINYCPHIYHSFKLTNRQQR